MACNSAAVGVLTFTSSLPARSVHCVLPSNHVVRLLLSILNLLPFTLIVPLALPVSFVPLKAVASKTASMPPLFFSLPAVLSRISCAFCAWAGSSVQAQRIIWKMCLMFMALMCFKYYPMVLNLLSNSISSAISTSRGFAPRVGPTMPMASS